MIPKQKVKIKWSTSTKQYYIDKGYAFTKIGDEFEVDLKDLPTKSSEKVRFICDYCGNEEWGKYGNLIQGRGLTGKDCCKKRDCRSKKFSEAQRIKPIPKGKSLAEKSPHLIEEWLFEKNGDLKPENVTYASGQKVWWKCKKCNYEWMTQIYNRAYGSGCPACDGDVATPNYNLAVIFKHLADEFHPTKNGDLTPYNITPFTAKKIWWKCRKCNYEWKAKVCNRSNGRGCPSCGGQKRISHEEFIQKVRDLVGDEYEVLGEYRGVNKKVKMRHTKCENIINVIPYNFITKRIRCIYCSGNVKKDTKTFKRQVYDLVGDEYTVLGEYINRKTKIKVKHNLCGYEYDVLPPNFLRGRRCPKCNESHGEIKISRYLDDNNIKYIREYRFKDCRNVFPLPFDFAIFDNENNLKMLIEYDGEQHYKPLKIFGGEEHLNKVKYNDNIKNTYCKNNNIYLLRIPYWKLDNIEVILQKELFKRGIINDGADK